MFSHLPQCAGVVFVSTHASPQNVLSSGHLHIPFEQICPFAQAGVQRALSGKHCPCWQASPAAQVLPQLPQFTLSFTVSTQPLGQLASVLGHEH